MRMQGWVAEDSRYSSQPRANAEPAHPHPIASAAHQNQQDENAKYSPSADVDRLRRRTVGLLARELLFFRAHARLVDKQSDVAARLDEVLGRHRVPGEA